MVESAALSVSERLRIEREACEKEKVLAEEQVIAAKAKSEELQAELKARKAEKIAAERTALDSEARANMAREAVGQAQWQAALASASVANKDAQLALLSECAHIYRQRVRNLEKKHQQAVEEVHKDASKSKLEIERMRRDLSEHDALRRELHDSRCKMGELQNAMENARSNASAALSERDALRTSLEEGRLRFVECQKEISALKDAASASERVSTAYVEQLEQLRHDLREAKRSKVSNQSETILLRNDLKAAKNEAAVALGRVDALSRTLDALKSHGATGPNETQVGKIEVNAEGVRPMGCIETDVAYKSASPQKPLMPSSSEELRIAACGGRHVQDQHQYHHRDQKLVQREKDSVSMSSGTGAATILEVSTEGSRPVGCIETDVALRATSPQQSRMPSSAEKLRIAAYGSDMLQDQHQYHHGNQKLLPREGGTLHVSSGTGASTIQHASAISFQFALAQEMIAQGPQTKLWQFEHNGFALSCGSNAHTIQQNRSAAVPQEQHPMFMHAERHLQFPQHPLNAEQQPLRLASAEQQSRQQQSLVPRQSERQQPQPPHPKQHKTIGAIQIRSIRSRTWQGVQPLCAKPFLKQSRSKIFNDCLKKVGYTKWCRGCKDASRGGERKRMHSDECRSRVQEALMRISRPDAWHDDGGKAGVPTHCNTGRNIGDQGSIGKAVPHVSQTARAPGRARDAAARTDAAVG